MILLFQRLNLFRKPGRNRRGQFNGWSSASECKRLSANGKAFYDCMEKRDIILKQKTLQFIGEQDSLTCVNFMFSKLDSIWVMMVLWYWNELAIRQKSKVMSDFQQNDFMIYFSQGFNRFYRNVQNRRNDSGPMHIYLPLQRIWKERKLKIIYNI